MRFDGGVGVGMAALRFVGKAKRRYAARFRSASAEELQGLEIAVAAEDALEGAPAPPSLAFSAPPPSAPATRAAFLRGCRGGS